MTSESSESEVIFHIDQEDLKLFKRLDAYLSSQLPDISRSLIKKYFEDGLFVSQTKIELKKMPAVGTTIKFLAPLAKDVDIVAQNIPLEILYEDENLLIINKEAGMVVHPAPGNADGTLVNAVLYHCKDLKGVGNEKRPGIVHRLDKGTSGVMVVAKEQKTHNALVELFFCHNIQRKYQAITLGAKIPSSHTLDKPIGRSPFNRLKMSTKSKNTKKAITHLKVLEYFERFSHVELTLETGRTHQIRVHLSELLNCPILNDPLYGRAKEEQLFMNSTMKALLKDYPHQLLHAFSLGFIHPVTKKELYFEKQPPQIFLDVLEQLRSD